MQGDTSMNIDDLDALLVDNSFTSDIKSALPSQPQSPKSKPSKNTITKTPTTNSKRRRPQFQKKIDLDALLNDLPVQEEGLITPKLSLNASSPDTSPKALSSPKLTNSLNQLTQNVENYLNSALSSAKIDILYEITQIVEKSNDYTRIIDPFMSSLKDDIKAEIVYTQNQLQDIDIESSISQFHAQMTNINQIKYQNYDTKPILNCHSFISSGQKVIDQIDQKQRELSNVVTDSISRNHPRYYPSFSNLESLKSKRLDCEVNMATLEMELADVKKRQEKIQQMRNKTSLLDDENDNSTLDSESSVAAAAFTEVRGLTQEMLQETTRISTFLSAMRREYDSEFRHMMSASSDWNDAFLIYYVNSPSSTPLSSPEPKHIPRVTLVEEEDEEDEEDQGESSELSVSNSSILEFAKMEQNIYAERRRKRDSELSQANAFLKDKMKEEMHNFRAMYRKPK